MFQFKLRNFLMGLILLCASSASNAELVQGNVGLIKGIITYTTYNSGDVVVEVTSPLENCANGFFVGGLDEGAKNVYAMLQAAYLTQKELYIYGNSTELWNGSSSGQYCHIYAVNYVDG